MSGTCKGKSDNLNFPLYSSWVVKEGLKFDHLYDQVQQQVLFKPMRTSVRFRLDFYWVPGTQDINKVESHVNFNESITFNLKHFQFTLSDWRSIKKKARKKQAKQWCSLWLLNFFAFKKSLLDALDQDYFTCACWKSLNLSVNAFLNW